MGKPFEISLSPRAVATINEILSARKTVEIVVREGKLQIFERKSRKRYEVVIQG